MAPFVTRLALAAALVGAVMIRPVDGCAVCVVIGDPLRMPHPHALRIAAATREAIENGTLRSSESETPTEFEANLVRFTSQLAYPQSITDLVIVDVLLVDESALYRVEVQGRHSRVSQVRADKHKPAPARVITTAPVVNSAGRLELRMAEALRKGLLEIEANPRDVGNLGNGHPRSGKSK